MKHGAGHRHATYSLIRCLAQKQLTRTDQSRTRCFCARHRTNNSRIKDLPDIALLASPLLQCNGAIDAATLRMALEKTFEFRATHALPDDVPQPPTSWHEPYAQIAKSDELT
ncbi:MAG: hypothetical protein ACJA0V_002733 [Planctomycetota bacterium]